MQPFHLKGHINTFNVKQKIFVTNVPFPGIKLFDLLDLGIKAAERGARRKMLQGLNIIEALESLEPQGPGGPKK